MPVDVQAVVISTVGGLGYELVDFERTAGGVLRVFIDKESGISVEDCASVSNHLTRVFAVENVDFDRLEVSSPGLDRPLKDIQAFQRFVGRGAKVKLNAMVDARKRFEGVIESVDGSNITFRLIEDKAVARALKASAPKSTGMATTKAKGDSKVSESKAGEVKLISVPVEKIDRARLIPEI
jgi:ribosome maturation factor RimP